MSYSKTKADVLDRLEEQENVSDVRIKEQDQSISFIVEGTFQAHYVVRETDYEVSYIAHREFSTYVILREYND